MDLTMKNMIRARGPSDFNKSQALGAWNSISAFVFYFD